MSPQRRCNVCGDPLGPGRCTNGRCSGCHQKYCTSGGATSPGHGLGSQMRTQPRRKLCIEYDRLNDELDGLYLDLDGVTEETWDSDDDDVREAVALRAHRMDEIHARLAEIDRILSRPFKEGA